MAAYLEKTKYAVGLITKLEEKYPDIKHDPDLYKLMYAGIRAMPRGPQQVVKRNYLDKVIREVEGKVVSALETRQNWKEEDYDDLTFNNK